MSPNATFPTHVGQRLIATIDHLRKELAEAKANAMPGPDEIEPLPDTPERVRRRAAIREVVLDRAPGPPPARSGTNCYLGEALDD